MPSEGQRLALIIASSKFTDRTLQQLVAPGQDAADLARVLADAMIGSFDVKFLINRLSHEVRREIETFFTNRKRNDLLLLYFSGHGVKDDDGQLYLTTTDTQRGLLRSTAVPATFVNETMTASRSRRQVLILDCCHSGAFARGMVAKGSERVDVRDRFEGRGRVVLTASNATQYAFQGDKIIGEGIRSVFTRCLVQGLEAGEADLSGDGWVTLDELYEYVYDRVTDETPQQTPGKWAFDLQGEIIIAKNPRPVVRPAAPPPPRYTPPPTSQPQSLPVYSAAPSPPQAHAVTVPAEDKKSRTRLWVGCGCLVLLVIVACVGIFVLDYLGMLPLIFYRPLFWLGLDRPFTP